MTKLCEYCGADISHHTHKLARLIKAAAMEIKAHQAAFMPTMEYRKIKGPYLDNGQVCVDYEYEPMERD